MRLMRRIVIRIVVIVGREAAGRHVDVQTLERHGVQVHRRPDEAHRIGARFERGNRDQWRDVRSSAMAKCETGAGGARPRDHRGLEGLEGHLAVEPLVQGFDDAVADVRCRSDSPPQEHSSQDRRQEQSADHDSPCRPARAVHTHPFLRAHPRTRRAEGPLRAPRPVGGVSVVSRGCVTSVVVAALRAREMPETVKPD
jgi:hypothetical protein